jgi:hypothetical protein
MIRVSTRAKIYRVMIASPSDLREERRAAAEAVNEWNVQHADAGGKSKGEFGVSAAFA